MLSRYFSSEKSLKKKWDKEVSLVVDDPHNPEGYALKVPRRCLLEHSKFFKEKEEEVKKSKKIRLEEVSITALQKIVEYMLKSSVAFLNNSEVLETLKASHAFRMEKIFDTCSNHLLSVLDPHTVCDIYDLAFQLGLSQLEYPCLKLIDASADQVLASRGFLTLSRDSMREVVQRDTLKVASETVVFRSVLGWCLNDCLRRGVDADDLDKFVPAVKSLFGRVRFGAMSEEELSDPDVARYRSLLEPWARVRSASELTDGTEEAKSPRRHVDRYGHDLNLRDSSLSSVKSGETFALNVEVLKGRVFFTGFRLGFCRFAATKSDACLYVLLTATNTSSQEQKTTRGTFLNTEDESVLTFGAPLRALEAETVEFSLSVKKAENICPLAAKKDIQIAMPESKAVALKVTPKSACDEDVVRCVFQELKYFF